MIDFSCLLPGNTFTFTIIELRKVVVTLGLRILVFYTKSKALYFVPKSFFMLSRYIYYVNNCTDSVDATCDSENPIQILRSLESWKIQRELHVTTVSLYNRLHCRFTALQLYSVRQIVRLTGCTELNYFH